jgi:hypothetical protein
MVTLSMVAKGPPMLESGESLISNATFTPASIWAVSVTLSASIETLLGRNLIFLKKS